MEASIESGCNDPYLSCLRNNEAVTPRDLADAAWVTEIIVRTITKDLKYSNVSHAISDKTFFLNFNDRGQTNLEFLCSRKTDAISQSLIL